MENKEMIIKAYFPAKLTNCIYEDWLEYLGERGVKNLCSIVDFTIIKGPRNEMFALVVFADMIEPNCCYKIETVHSKR